MMRSSVVRVATIVGMSIACGTALAGSAQAPTSAASAPGTGAGEQRAPAAAKGYFCPMHPEVTSTAPGGACGKCGMKLIAGDPFDTREYALEFSTVPAAVKAGAPFRMHFTVRHPGSGEVIKAFETVHDKGFHLFVISQDMEAFQHIHPAMQADGTWTLDVTLPKPGYYRVLTDFLPSGGSPQFLGRALVTADFDGDLASQGARLEPDSSMSKSAKTITATLSFDPLANGLPFQTQKLIEGRWGHMTYLLTDISTGEPVIDLQPYLGAFGHTLIMSEDLRDYVHSHPTTTPVDGTPSTTPAVDISQGRGGPKVEFEGYMPRSGRYRAWTQFQRAGTVETVSFTFTVATFEEVAPPAR